MLTFHDPRWRVTYLGRGEEKAVFCVCDHAQRVFAVELMTNVATNVAALLPAHTFWIAGSRAWLAYRSTRTPACSAYALLGWSRYESLRTGTSGAAFGGVRIVKACLIT